MTVCWSPARTNSAAGVVYGWFCSGGGVWPQKRLSWREGGIRAWAVAMLGGALAAGEQLMAEEKGRQCPSFHRVQSWSPWRGVWGCGCESDVHCK